jgi:putative acetyltransferase
VKISIRDASDSDGNDLITLIDDCWSEYPGCVLDVDAEVPELRAIATHFRLDGGRFWVAVRASTVVGCVGMTPRPDGVQLHKLYVARSDRHRGLGSRLVGLVEDHAETAGARFVELWSDTRFTAAHRLYERLGYYRQPQTRSLGDLSNTVEFQYRKALAGDVSGLLRQSMTDAGPED